jgi:hypothetical protein
MTTNHPAHGPVSLDRLHQIREILSKAAAQSDGGNIGYAMADAVKVIDWAIAEFEEQDNPRPVMAVKGELGFIENLEKIIEERDEDIDIGQLGCSNYDALMLATLDAFRASLPAPVVPDEMVNNIDNPYGDEDLIYEQGKIEGWNACRSAMLQAGNSPVTPDCWIPVSERMPPSGGSEQRYVLAADFSNHYWPNIPNTQVGVYGDWFNDGNPTWDDGDGEDLHLKEVTHWMPLPAAPQQEVKR